MISHRRFVVVSWIALALGVVAVSQAVGKRTSNDFSLPNTDSQRAFDLLQNRFPAQAGDVDQIVFRGRTGTLGDESVRAVIVPLLDRIARLPHVAGVISPYAPVRMRSPRTARSPSPRSSSTNGRNCCRPTRSTASSTAPRRRALRRCRSSSAGPRSRRRSSPASASRPLSASAPRSSCCCSASAPCSRWDCRS
jgi:hypothetical protein